MKERQVTSSPRIQYMPRVPEETNYIRLLVNESAPVNWSEDYSSLSADVEMSTFDLRRVNYLTRVWVPDRDQKDDEFETGHFEIVVWAGWGEKEPEEPQSVEKWIRENLAKDLTERSDYETRYVYLKMYRKVLETLLGVSLIRDFVKRSWELEHIKGFLKGRGFLREEDS